MIPSNSLILLLVIGAIPLSLGIVNPLFIYATMLYNIVLALILCADLIVTPPASALSISRICDGKLSLGAENPIMIKIKNRSPFQLRVLIKDEFPYQFEIRGEKAIPVNVRGFEEKRISYRVIPKERGDYSFGKVNIRCISRAGLFIRQSATAQGREVRVYPNLIDLKKYQIMLRRGHLPETGLKHSKIYGQGTEFERLRDYQPDYGFRSINWKATARMGRLISIEHEVERSQNIFIFLDTGRLMHSPIAGISRLDYAINAALLLAYVATLKDDKVGMVIFSQDIKAYIPPRRGSRHLYLITKSLYNIRSELVEPDYRKAFLFFRSQKSRRSLAVVFTELVEGESSKSLEKHLSSLHPYHLPLCVTMKDSTLSECASRTPETSQDVFEKAVARQVLLEREQVLGRLSQRGCLTLDAIPRQLSIALVNKYLELKGKTLL